MQTSFFTRLVALAAIASVVAAQTPPDCVKTVITKLGDTCDKICAANSVSTYQLETVNHDIVDGKCDNLVPNETLCLGITGQYCDVVHVVQTGDICYEVAYQANITLTTLYANNPNINSTCGNIYPGEVLCTSSVIYPYNTTN
ncbi:uncharacterized protein EDB91DRAFT_724335 [Suillus paluster]|uniref:uncharacterized protein n=1 Tax=Suillus paluster TaxID=48578 RepID=UPI001B881168|nr:uncharacterized protein EDB91DRAFT_724335 [Suillus paluster]KAG1731323.1 hypothetical protein EDB91DRAFT_724335 [Suillus paluster]